MINKMEIGRGILLRLRRTFGAGAQRNGKGTGFNAEALWRGGQRKEKKEEAWSVRWHGEKGRGTGMGTERVSGRETGGRWHNGSE